MIPNPKKLMAAKRQADEIKKILETETVEVKEDGVVIRMSGDERVLYVEIDGEENTRIKKAFNKANKEVKKVQFKKLRGRMEDMGFGL